MELIHLIKILGGLLKGFVEAIDKLFQKSAIPDLDQLRDNPHGALDHGEIVIGPARNYGTATFAALGMGFVGHAVGTVLFLLSQRLPGFQWVNRPLILTLCLAFDFGCFYYFFRYFRGGTCTLKQEGVEFRYQSKVVRCSWAVFDSWGQPVHLEDSNLLLLPISPHATDLIEEMNSEETSARCKGLQVRTPHWETRSSTEAVLKPLYVVDGMKLAGLLLELGQKLKSDQSTAACQISGGKENQPDSLLLQPELLSFPIATREDSGWIRISLANLIFPPYCCVCTMPTSETHIFRCPNKEDIGEFQIRLPTCKECRKSLRRIKVNISFALVLVSLICLLVLVLSYCPIPGHGQVLAAILAAMIGINCVIWAVASLVFHYFRQPVKVRYSSDKGTLRIRFRNPDCEEIILAMRAMNPSLVDKN